MKRKFKLGDHVSYSSKKMKYSLTGTVIGIDYQGYYLIETDSFQGTYPYIGTKDINDGADMIAEYFHAANTWGTRRTKSNRCVWEHARGLNHSLKEYVYDQSGDTDEDI
ncbi:hypothetical protein EVB99_046 [Rhizobium phage RHph_N3_19]|nr:hypothetical protein EVB99_046 [Rhizobium phage RHph_N3_19]